MKTKHKVALGSIIAILLLCVVVVLLYPLFLRIACKNSSYLSLFHLRWIDNPDCSISDGDYSLISERFSGGDVEIVSAEKVFSGLHSRLKWVDNHLVSENYMLALPPDNPEGNTPVERWGSSFYSWGMPADKWQSTPDFRWKNNAFPFIWDKKPELNDGKVNFLTIDNTLINTLPSAEFEILIQKALEWLEPEKISMEELENTIKKRTEEEKAFAIRMLGRKGDKRGLEIIKPFLSGNDRRLREAAEYALGNLEEKNEKSNE